MLASDGMLDVLTCCSFFSAAFTVACFFSFTDAMLGVRSVSASAPTTSVSAEAGFG